MRDKYGHGTISVPVSDGNLSRDALKNLRNRTGLALDPHAEDDMAVPRISEDIANDMGRAFETAADETPAAAEPVIAADDDDDDFDWGDDDEYYVVVDKPVVEPEAKKKRTVVRTRRPRP